MRVSFAGERILAVMAHPDDCELVCAGTLARASEDGAAAVAICVACAGDKGAPAVTQSAPDRRINAPAAAVVAPAVTGNAPELARVRREEATSAAVALGAELFWLGYPDGELFDGVEQRRKLMEVYRRFAPTLVIAHAMEDYHPDHRAASALAEAASWFASSRGHVTETKPIAQPPAVWFADTINMCGFAPEFYVDVTEHVGIKEKMLHCHKSQLQRSGDRDFAPLMELMMNQCRARGGQAGVEAAEAFRSHQAFKRVRAW